MNELNKCALLRCYYVCIFVFFLIFLSLFHCSFPSADKKRLTKFKLSQLLCFFESCPTCYKPVKLRFIIDFLKTRKNKQLFIFVIVIMFINRICFNLQKSYTKNNFLLHTNHTLACIKINLLSPAFDKFKTVVFRS